jgi:tRNA threonylcarbamoyladenosine biosynthesis protein TsaB
MQLCIDAADDRPGVALAVNGIVGFSVTWETQQNHSKELLPNIDRLLAEAERAKADLSAVFVDVGPGGYAALRVGVSIAKGLAHGLDVPIVGVGRLELDAWSAAEEGRRDARCVAVHRAGRGELAWAAYSRYGDTWREVEAPRIAKAEQMYAALSGGDVVTGDIDDGLADVVQRVGAEVLSSPPHRVIALAAVGHHRLAAGAVDAAEALVPMYLRAPAIGPQR